MSTTALPKTGPVEFKGWLCNGSIYPLIRDYEQLKAIAGADISRAICYVSIELACHFHEGESLTPQQCAALSDSQRCALFASWLQHKRQPSWRRLPPILKAGDYEPRTTAQLLARHGNLHCQAECCDIQDLCAALRYTQGYNDFDPFLVAMAFERFNVGRYYTNHNPNSGRDCFTYFYGWEGSSVVYIQAPRLPILALDRKWQHWTELDTPTFAAMAQALATTTKADECTCSEGGSLWRLWWD